MKILFLESAKLKYVPYIHFYTDNIDRERNDLHILFWNRDMQEEDLSAFQGCTIHEFRYYQENTVEKRAKITGFLKYRAFAKKVMEQEDFDCIIVSGAFLGVLFYKLLMKKYPGKFLLDYRDFTYENIPPYRARLAKLVEASQGVFISSDAFRRILPETCRKKIYTIHNISVPNTEGNYRFEKVTGQIVIGYVGLLSYLPQCLSLMDLVARDDRFILSFYGAGPAYPEICAHIDELHCDRIRQYGSYTQNQKGSIIGKLHILFNAYGNGYPMVDMALSNKLYDAFYYRKPLLTSPHTYMTECGGILAFPFDPRMDNLDALWNWYMGLDAEAVDVFASASLRSAVEENAATRQALKTCFETLAANAKTENYK